MSFGWSAGDVASAVAILIKVGKSLKNSDGAAKEYQDTAEFIQNLVKTLEGLKVFLEKNPEIECKDNLVEQADAMKHALEAFKKKIEKYDLSLGSATIRGKARRIPREIQFALLVDVKELRTAATHPFVILSFWVSQQTL